MNANVLAAAWGRCARRAVGARFMALGRRPSEGRPVAGSARAAMASAQGSASFGRIAVFGAGVMADLIVGRLVTTASDRGTPSPAIRIYDVVPQLAESVVDRWVTAAPNLTAVDSVDAAVDGAELILLAVKPQNIDSVARDLERARATVPSDVLVLSILAGTPLSTLQAKLALPKVVRAMPNTPAALGEGITVWAHSEHLLPTDIESVEGMLMTLGESVRVADEEFVDMATALSGSGPAFVYLAMEAMADAGVQLGFPRETSVKLVQSTFRGTGAYAMQSHKHLTQLRNDITSPGGTTAAALYVLEKGRLRTTLCDAVLAAHAKAKSLGSRDHSLPDGFASGFRDDSF